MIQAIQVLRFHLLELEKVCFCCCYYYYYLESRQLYKRVTKITASNNLF